MLIIVILELNSCILARYFRINLEIRQSMEDVKAIITAFMKKGLTEAKVKKHDRALT